MFEANFYHAIYFNARFMRQALPSASSGSSGNWPLSLDDVKAYLRVDASDDDAVISSLIDFACDFIQRETAQQMLTATYTYYLDRFPVHELGVSFITGTMQVASSRHEIRLPNPPLQSITSIQYMSNGVLTTLDPTIYTVDAAGKPGRIVLNCGQSWPVTDGVANAVKIVYVAGYGDASTVPNMFKQAIKWFVAHCYENREAVTVDARVAVQELPWGLRAIVESLMFRDAICA